MVPVLVLYTPPLLIVPIVNDGLPELIEILSVAWM
jgi:hypothetical protein